MNYLTFLEIRTVKVCLIGLNKYVSRWSSFQEALERFCFLTFSTFLRPPIFLGSSPPPTFKASQVLFTWNHPDADSSLSLYHIKKTLVLWCSYVRCIYIYNCYIFFLDWSFDHYAVSFFVSFHSLYLKVY